MDAGGLGQGPEIPRVGGKDVVAIGGKANKHGIYCIPSPASAHEGARPLGQLLVEGPHVDAAQQAGDLGLKA